MKAIKFFVDPRHVKYVLRAIYRWFPDKSKDLIKLAGKSEHGVVLQLSPFSNRRSVQQNARYWTIVSALADEIGYHENAMHEELLCEFHGYDLVTNPINKEVRKVPKGRSKDQDPETFNELMRLAERWAGEMGVTINERKHDRFMG